MSIIDALKEKQEALVKVDVSEKHSFHSNEFREYIKNHMAEEIGRRLLKEGIIVIDETKGGDEITMDACLYVIDTRKLKEGGEK